MKIERLRTLDRDMRRKNLTRTQFKYRHNNLVFDVLFIVEGSYELLFGTVGHNCSFIVEVKPGYNIDPMIKPTSVFYKLCELLHLTPDPSNRFSAKAFFSEFAAKIPEIADEKTTAQLPQSISPDIDDADRTVFMGWRNNTEKSGHVRGPNLDKTLKAFGPVIRDFCASRNISSRWSPKKDD